MQAGLLGRDFDLMILAGIIAAMASAGATSAPAPATVSATPTETAALETLNREWLTAYKTRDGAVLERILADDFEAVYPGGSVLKKADLIKAATNPRRTVADISWENLKIMVFGDVAVVSARSRMAGTTEGRAFSGVNDYADVYVKRSGTWRAVSAHVVRVSE